MKFDRQIHARTALKDGLRPESFTFMRYPVARVRLEQPTATANSEWTLMYKADMPADTPQEDAHNQSALAWVLFNLVDHKGTIINVDKRGHIDGKVVGGMTRDFCLANGQKARVKLEATPIFFPYVKDGGAQLQYGNTATGYVKGKTATSRFYILEVTEEGDILLDGERRPEPEHVEIGVKEGDEQMRKEREAYEAKERQVREEARKANEEANRKAEQEIKEAVLAKKKAEREAHLKREQEKRDQKREKARAAKERKKLNIKPDQIYDILSASDNNDVVALANLWSGQYAPYDVDGFKERLQQIGLTEAEDEIYKLLGWSK